MPAQVTNVASDDALTAIYRIHHDEQSEVIAARLAERLEVTQPSISGMLRRLQRDQLIEIDSQKRITLTGQGFTRAEEMIRRHRLAECLLVDTLGLEWWRAYEEAHLLEHALSEITEPLVRAHLGDPQLSPFGYPIPGVSTTTTMSRQTLADLDAGEPATVERVFEEDEDLLRFFDDVGMRPGAIVQVERHQRPLGVVEVALAESVVTMGYPAARRVWIQPAPRAEERATRKRGATA